MTSPQPSFWTEYGPNKFETLLLGIAGAAAVILFLGDKVLVGGLIAAGGVALVSYGIRKFVKP